jgi:hypothetical protein
VHKYLTVVSLTTADRCAKGETNSTHLQDFETALHPQARATAAASSATHHKHVRALWATCTAVLASSCISTARCAACSLPRDLQCMIKRSHGHGATQPQLRAPATWSSGGPLTRMMANAIGVYECAVACVTESASTLCTYHLRLVVAATMR